MKINEVIAAMEAYHVNFDLDVTCDGVIVGDPDKECTGVAVTCGPSADVIKKAAGLGCNLLICHEPLFYVGDDKTSQVGANEVKDDKLRLIADAGMVIYRNHDHLHSDTPDGIFSGVIKLLGWENYAADINMFPGCVFNIPATTVGAIAKQLADIAHIHGVRIIGKPDMEVSRAGIMFHFMGSEMDTTGLNFIEENDVQVIITGETVDWTVGAYVQDALTFGKKRALLMPGHYNWEEPGMAVFADKLRELTGDELPVHFLQSGSGFDWLRF